MKPDPTFERALDPDETRVALAPADQGRLSALHNANDADHSDAFGPTAEAYGELLSAYAYFNETLFDQRLPACLITLNRRGRRTLGYFCRKRFIRLRDGSTATDEIALNPSHFAGRDAAEILSVLVHEMAHLWQAHFGEPSRGGYHNAAWAEKMEQIGLQPSDTGYPGGKRTGQQMSHYILHGGLFSRATDALLRRGFRITWGDARLQPTSGDAPDDRTGGPGLVGNRVKYICPGCSAAAWGKPELHLLCGDCHRPMPGAHTAVPSGIGDPSAGARRFPPAQIHATGVQP